DLLAEDVVVESSPAAGPPQWRYVEGKREFVTMYTEFLRLFGGNFQVEGRCIEADDRVAISLVRGTGRLANGTVFENEGVHIMRFDEAGLMDRLWTVALDEEKIRAFWDRNPAPGAARTSSSGATTAP